MQPYTEEFFRNISEGSRCSAREIVSLVLQLVQPEQVVDIGCGTGTWLSAFKERGDEEVLGVDGGWVDEERLEIPKEQFMSFDLTKPLQLDRQFDLVVSLEVAEHLPGECAVTFVESLTRLGPAILFSAAISLQGGTYHLNEQWPDYWAERFRRKGYLAIDCIREKIWQNPNVERHYAQNILMFARQDLLESNPLLSREFKNTTPSQLSIVHPKTYSDVVGCCMGST